MGRLLPVLTLIVAAGIVVLGSAVGCAGLVLGPSGDRASSLGTATHSASITILSSGLGIPLAWQALRAVRGCPSALFRPKRIWLFGLIFILALTLGQGVVSLGLLPEATFPAFHLAAGALPAFIIVALVGRRLGAVVTWREMIAHTGSGALLATPMAFVLEATTLLGLITAVVLGVAARTGGQELLRRVVDHAQDPILPLSPTLLTPTAGSPFVLAAMATFFAGVVPLLEEGVKTLGTALMMSYRETTQSQSLLWGLAAGAGFALVESLLNTTGALEAWAPLVLLRVGATLLHCFTGALTGLAWYQVLVRRRWRPGLGLYLAATATHGLWNALSSTLALLTPGVLGNVLSDAAIGLVVVTILALLAAMTLAVGGSLLGLVQYVRKRDASPDSRTARARVQSADSEPVILIDHQDETRGPQERMMSK